MGKVKTHSCRHTRTHSSFSRAFAEITPQSLEALSTAELGESFTIRISGSNTSSATFKMCDLRELLCLLNDQSPYLQSWGNGI